METLLKLVLQVNLWINFFALLEQMLIKSAGPFIFIFDRWTSRSFVCSSLVVRWKCRSLNGGRLQWLLSRWLLFAKVLWTTFVLLLHCFAILVRRLVTHVTITNDFLVRKWVISFWKWNLQQNSVLHQNFWLNWLKLEQSGFSVRLTEARQKQCSRHGSEYLDVSFEPGSSSVLGSIFWLFSNTLSPYLHTPSPGIDGLVVVASSLRPSLGFSGKKVA